MLSPARVFRAACKWSQSQQGTLRGAGGGGRLVVAETADTQSLVAVVSRWEAKCQYNQNNSEAVVKRVSSYEVSGGGWLNW